MSADIERLSGIEIPAAAKSLNSAVLALTSSISLVPCRARAVSTRSWPCAGEHEQVIGEHPQPDPPLHATGASVATPPKSVTTFECADASFAACAPAEGHARRARARLPRLAWQDNSADPRAPAPRRPALIAPGREAAVGHRQLRSVIEERDVPIQGRRPEGALGLAALTHHVVGDELPLGLLDL